MVAVRFSTKDPRRVSVVGNSIRRQPRQFSPCLPYSLTRTDVSPRLLFLLVSSTHARVDTFSNDRKSNGIALIVVACFPRLFRLRSVELGGCQYHARLIILVEFLINRSITRPELRNRAGNLLLFAATKIRAIANKH